MNARRTIGDALGPVMGASPNLDGSVTYDVAGAGQVRPGGLAHLAAALGVVGLALIRRGDHLRLTVSKAAVALPPSETMSPPEPQAQPAADYPPIAPVDWWRLVDLGGIGQDYLREILRQIGAAIEAGDGRAVHTMARLAVDVTRPVTYINQMGDQVEALARFAIGLTGRQWLGELEAAFRLFCSAMCDQGSYNAALAAYARAMAASDVADCLRWLAEAQALIDGRGWTHYDGRRVHRLTGWISGAQAQAVPVVWVNDSGNTPS